MRKLPAAALPDIDDEVFKQRLAPLARAVLPAGPERTLPDGGAGSPAGQDSGVPDTRHAGPSGDGKGRPPIPQVPAPAVVGAPRPTRGPRRGVEFLLPEQVMVALKTEAAQRGTSMSVRVLEMLRDTRYPVRDQDVINLRKLPRKRGRRFRAAQAAGSIVPGGLGRRARAGEVGRADMGRRALRARPWGPWSRGTRPSCWF